MKTGSIIVVLVDVASVQRLVDFAKTVYGLGFRDFVAARVYGAASTSGIPEVTRIALREKKGFYILGSAREAVEVFQPEEVLVVSREYGEPVDPGDIVDLVKGRERVMVVFGGSDAAPAREEVSLGRPVYPRGTVARLSPIAEAALVLYPIARELGAITG